MTVLHFKRHYVQNICDADVIGINYRPDNLYVQLQGIWQKTNCFIIWNVMRVSNNISFTQPREREEHSYCDYDKKLCANE